MARFKDREVALQLRKREFSYSQIKQILNVSKGTLSLWLRDYPLSHKRINELRAWNQKRIERFRETMRKKKETRLRQIYQKEKSKIFPLNRKEKFIAGLFLYWGEGAKTAETRLAVSNTDPAVLKFFITWCMENLDIPKNKFHAFLHLYKDMKINKEIKYWATILGIPKDQFRKPYIKTSSRIRINHKGSFGHGTCTISIGNARISERILMGIKAISDKYMGQ